MFAERGRVLLIEDWEHQGDFNFLISRLRKQDIQVDVMPSNELFSTLSELQAFDCIILAMFPRLLEILTLMSPTSQSVTSPSWFATRNRWVAD